MRRHHREGDRLERITISLSEEFAAELAAFMAAQGYDNRSEAVRDLARIGLKRSRSEAGIEGDCVATLSYVFDHHARELPRRLTEMHHAAHDLQVASMHVHLDHHDCLEVTVLRGKSVIVRDFANSVMAERGVKHGALNIVPCAVDETPHSHGPGNGHHTHTHLRPKY